MSFLSLTDIHKSYYLEKQEFPVIKGVTLDFELGEFVSILGESGGGKSTLMNIIGGLDRNFTGQVTLQGQPMDHHDEAAMNRYRRDTVGYIYQSYNLISHLTVLDNVLVPLDMSTLSKADRRERAQQLLARVGLAQQGHKYPSQLSGGQKQRVAIARALASDPQVIIADEPTGALDSENTAAVLKILDEIAAEGKLVIAVTHSQAVADAGTRIVHLADGQIDRDTQVRPAYQATVASQPKSRKLPFWANVKNALKHLRYSWKTSSLITIGTAIGLFAVILFSGLGNGIGGYINKQITDVANPRVVTVSKKQKTTTQLPGGSSNPMATVLASMSTTKPTITTAEQARVARMDHVQRVQPTYTLSNVKVNYGRHQTTIVSLGNWTDASTASSVKVGHTPKQGEIVLDETAVAKKLQKKNWRQLVGKKVRLTYTTTEHQQKKTMKIRVKVAGIGKSTTQAAVTGVNTQTLIAGLKTAGMTTKPTSLTVKVDQMTNVKAVQNKIKALQVQRKKVFTTTSIASMITTLQTYVHLASSLLSVIAAISLLVSAMMIIVTMYMAVSARTKEIGILRALGESRHDIRLLFLSESLVIGLLSAVVATGLAFGLGAVANHLLLGLASYKFVQISGGNVALIFGLAIIISLLAAIWPARHAARLNPIEALSAE
ncbi:ABC transporter ATP-binding protein/permease [Levilactobacillus namurensis]|uniref:ABC transporter ATP-binding protein/permease n=1 Tax=Levilactobacillus namurensis TaxID=380393 RepID=UPI002231319D|nr:ABC transporter ATP-binding protein/permease [Levilactobacillus namurensis]MCW3778125.1 ATP-binding cassette domain-containing protein [Levilactobacillus namurensis]